MLIGKVQKDAIERGNIVVNGEQVPSIHTKIANGDMISHTLHRHEPPVTAEPIRIVHEDDDMVVVSKPAGMPTHPAGRYRYNCLTEIMRAARGGGWNPMPCNRLDRLTSGILFVGKHRKAADEIGVKLKTRTIRKEYVARVAGEFPGGEVLCEQPILQISHKLGLNRVRANGKDARTVFRRLAYYPPKEQPSSNEDDAGNQEVNGMPWKRKRGYSVVRCLPLTGRTHQIRVHLQFLGHPISNDPIYSNQRVFGHNLGQGDADSDNDEDVISRLSKMGKDEVADAIAYHDDLVEDYNKRKAEKMTGEHCELCGTPLYTDPGIHELGIYLHALRYACAEGSWEYETPLPEWALPPEGTTGPTQLTQDTDPLAAKAAQLQLDDTSESADKIGPS